MTTDYQEFLKTKQYKATNQGIEVDIENKETVNDLYHHNYYLENKVVIKEKQHARRCSRTKEQKEYINNYNKKWRAAHPKEYLERQRKYRANMTQDQRDRRNETRRRYYLNHKEESRNKTNEWYREHPKVKLNGHYKANYGIELCDYERLLIQQNNCCAICGKPHGESKKEKLHVDHNHKTKEIRGLLCRSCNHGIGNFNDSPQLLQSAIEYLISNKTELVVK